MICENAVFIRFQLNTLAKFQLNPCKLYSEFVMPHEKREQTFTKNGEQTYLSDFKCMSLGS